MSIRPSISLIPPRRPPRRVPPARAQNRQRVPAIDAPLDLARFVPHLDRRNRPLLVSQRPAGKLVAIVPGGTRLVDQEDCRDLPLLWRYAVWSSHDAIDRDRAPEFVLDTSLSALVARHGDHAAWMLERSGEQLATLVRRLVEDGSSAYGLMLAYRRTLYVLGELDAGIAEVELLDLATVPPAVRATRREAIDAIDRARPLEGIEGLAGHSEAVTIRRRGLRWQGPARQALLVFLKTYEATQAIAANQTRNKLDERLLLLERSIEMSNGKGRAFRPLQRKAARIRSARDRFPADSEWPERERRKAFRSLRAELRRLRSGLAESPALGAARAERSQRYRTQAAEVELLRIETLRDLASSHDLASGHATPGLR